MKKDMEKTVLNKKYNNLNFYTPQKEDSMGYSSLLSRSAVPLSHKRIADNYMFLKKMYGSFMIFSQVTKEEHSLLLKFDFSPLEYSTSNQIEEEIKFLKKWSASQDFEMAKSADKILEIRVKELKNIVSNRYVFVSNEIYTGFKLFEQYLENISKYN